MPQLVLAIRPVNELPYRCTLEAKPRAFPYVPHLHQGTNWEETLDIYRPLSTANAAPETYTMLYVLQEAA